MNTASTSPIVAAPVRKRRLKRALMMGAIGSLVAFAVTGGVGGSMTWMERAMLLVTCSIYGMSIGLAAPFVMPRWVRRVASRGGASWWVGRVLALPFIILGGGAIASVLLIPLHLIQPASALQLMFPYLRRPAIGIVAVIFIAVTGYEYLRERLDAATLALRTRERDEAEARRLAAEAQLASLESRVQPHFLFNTLNSIAALIVRDPAGAEKMTGQLASLLRSSLDASAVPLVPLAVELKTVRDYLDIEQVRFGDRIRVRIEVDETLQGCPIPRLSLQTLVENSVKYAVAPRLEGATIAIRAARAGNTMRVEVCDDGPGFDAGAIVNGHGLALVRDRLRMTIGDRGRLIVEGAQGHTTVAMEIGLDDVDAARLPRR